MTAIATRKRVQPFGPESNGIIMTPAEFDRADFLEGWRYELINGVLVVSPLPSEAEVDPNEELGHLLRSYQESHPHGSSWMRPCLNGLCVPAGIAAGRTV